MVFSKSLTNSFSVVMISNITSCLPISFLETEMRGEGDLMLIVLVEQRYSIIQQVFQFSQEHWIDFRLLIYLHIFEDK
jgi:hypothetical protein